MGRRVRGGVTPGAPKRSLRTPPHPKSGRHSLALPEQRGAARSAQQPGGQAAWAQSHLKIVPVAALSLVWENPHPTSGESSAGVRRPVSRPPHCPHRPLGRFRRRLLPPSLGFGSCRSSQSFSFRSDPVTEAHHCQSLQRMRVLPQDPAHLPGRGCPRRPPRGRVKWPIGGSPTCHCQRQLTTVHPILQLNMSKKPYPFIHPPSHFIIHFPVSCTNLISVFT